ncbi:hypothetical protein Y032_0363g3525 [Ancylostoma ceylanicum]|uniref:Uncharacterized protein n=1 Tax=Ancylostoma ceylanicum TaxID=53326 RepID=A0A016RVA0_9BILA|nr:hypothetical protein Y032_0363g3525 [Ancylostoma ceylanicum]
MALKGRKGLRWPGNSVDEVSAGTDRTCHQWHSPSTWLPFFFIKASLWPSGPRRRERRLWPSGHRMAKDDAHVVVAVDMKSAPSLSHPCQRTCHKWHSPSTWLLFFIIKASIWPSGLRWTARVMPL